MRVCVCSAQCRGQQVRVVMMTMTMTMMMSKWQKSAMHGKNCCLKSTDVGVNSFVISVSNRTFLMPADMLCAFAETETLVLSGSHKLARTP